MSPPSSNPSDGKAKKQASLTSFFSPKSTPAAPKPRQAPASSPLRPAEPSTRKRPLEEDADKGNNGPERPKRKKALRRVVDEDDLPEEAPRNEEEPPSEQELQNEKEPQDDAPSSQRTYHYLFGSSQDVDVDPEMLRRREELHRKFVRKLGHPDAVLSLRKYSNTAAVESPAGEEEGDDEGDEEEAPPPPKAKKGAKSSKSKLTPMEIQFLDIKRKHPDTLLIVEVGYKFRFFGEDARTAAKELSIVCIPGKFRFDERE